MTTSRHLMASAALALALLLAACSSSAGGTPAQPPPTQPTSASAAGNSPSSSQPTSADATTALAATPTLDVCALLPAGTVAQLTGIKVTKAEPNQLPQGASLSIATCNYTGGLNQLDITVARSRLAEHLFQTDYSTNKQVISKTAMVPGIGDKAFTADFPSMWLEVLWGDEQLEISGASTVDIAAAKRVLTELHAKV